MFSNSGEQILKTRDDARPVHFEATDDLTKPFSIVSEEQCSWAKDGHFGVETLRPRIEPWLTALAQSEHLSLLVGSGLPHAVYHIATKEKLPGMGPVKFQVMNKEINTVARKSAKLAGREKGNLEDQIRTANELLRGLEILESDPTSEFSEKEQAKALKEDINRVVTSFAESILQGESSLISAPSKDREEAFNYLVSFLMSFASRSGTRERLHIFTTNYDRYLEAGAEVAGLRLMDRFVGTLQPIFRSSRLDVDLHYNPPGIRGEPRYLEGVARYTKLHGSIDWVDCDRTIRRIGLPFGAGNLGSYLGASIDKGADATQLMVYPNAAKDRETAAYPYVELFRDLAAAVCRPNSTLICYGYSFGDEHINRVIEDMLTIPSAHLVVIARGDPLERIMDMYNRLGRHAQFTLLIGDHLGDLQTLVDHYLPKPAIDRTTFRMAELLKVRWDVNRGDSGGDSSPRSDDVGGLDE